jgi:hypothetical protein
MGQTRHEQVLVKVNAEVDRGLFPLVLALARWPGVCTTGSCEGNGEGPASVGLVLPTKEETLDFAFRILGRMIERHYEPWTRVELTIIAEDKPPSIGLYLPKDAVCRYAELLDVAYRQEFVTGKKEC